MSWDVPKSGVKLKLTRRGLSATFGAAPPHDTEIHSDVTSDSLKHLQRLLTETYNERDALKKEISSATMKISSATVEANAATLRYQDWERGFLMKRIRKQDFAARKDAADTAVAKLEELQEQLRQTTLATEFTIDREQAEPYYRMLDAFAVLSKSQKIWNVMTERPVNRFAERRSTENTAITRQPVSFSLSSCDLIKCEQTIPHLPNLKGGGFSFRFYNLVECEQKISDLPGPTGGDMYVYPGFILYRASPKAYSLINFRDMTLIFVPSQFTEAETIPSDAEVIGKTWLKADKDGSQDLRFKVNYQIPVARYGTLMFAVKNGSNLRYICSNAQSAEEFVKAWRAFRTSLDDQERTITVRLKAYEWLLSAWVGFCDAHERFRINITLQGGRMMSCEDFRTYGDTVMELITAARELESTSKFMPNTLRDTLRQTIDRLQASQKAFVKAFVDDRGVNDVNFRAFMTALMASVGVGLDLLNLCKVVETPWTRGRAC